MIWNKKRIRGFTALIFCLMLVITGGLPRYAEAAESSEAGEGLLLTINYQHEDRPAADVLFSIYRVADVSEDMTLTLTEDFQKYPVSLENLDSNGWKNLAETLAAFAARDQIPDLDSGRTGQDGRLTFPVQAASLEKGLYLVVGERYAMEGRIYTPEPVLVSLPNKNDNNEWIYDVVIVPKDSDDGEVTGIKVIKIWKDDGNEDKRPQEIGVQLLQDGTVLDEAVLNEDNSWQYTWDTLETGHSWQVVEKQVPAGYTVSVTHEGTVFAITNTYPGTPSGGSESNLPQTGVLWWPVPVLVICGLLFFAIGWVRRRNDESQE